MPKHCKKPNFFGSSSSSSCAPAPSSTSESSVYQTSTQSSSAQSSTKNKRCHKKSCSTSSLSCPSTVSCGSSCTVPVVTCAKNAPQSFSVFINTIAYNMMSSLNSTEIAELYNGNVNYVQYTLIIRKMRNALEQQLVKVNLSGLTYFTIVINNAVNLLPLINFNVKVRSVGKYKIHESTYKQYKNNGVANTQVYASLDSPQDIDNILATVSTLNIPNGEMLLQPYYGYLNGIINTYGAFDIWVTTLTNANDNIMSKLMGSVVTSVSGIVTEKLVNKVGQVMPEPFKPSAGVCDIMTGIAVDTATAMVAPNTNKVVIGIPVTWEYGLVPPAV